MQKEAETWVSGRDIKRLVRDTTERPREKNSEMGEGQRRDPGIAGPVGGAGEAGRQ